MTALNKQALPELRGEFEKWWEINYHNGNPPRFGWDYWRDGDGYKINDDESELDGMWEAWQAAHSSKLEAAEKRIAEHRKVLNNLAAVARRYLPDYDEHPEIQAADELLESTAGIGVKGE